MASGTRRDEQVRATRKALLDAAERLFAEYGVYAVSNRQISEAAGQGNNTAVTYHFGTKVDLVRALIRRHAEQIESIRVRMLADIGDSTELRDWVDCSVRPVTRHLEELGCPSWYARFIAQVTADPALYAIAEEEFYDLDGPVDRVDTAEVPMPYVGQLEAAELPQVETIEGAERRLLDSGGGDG